jgi:uncharacterized protein (DUF2236 family)
MVAAALQADLRMIRNELQRRLRRLLSGSQTGVPAWTPLVEVGDDLGLFAPSDAPWVVHADIATTIGGVRALLVQALHPGSLAGVMQHSRYEEDVLGRLHGTIRWLTISTFGSRAAIEQEAARVRAMHERVRGTYIDEHEQQRSYQASDQDLLQWVHLAFTESFLSTHLRYGRKAIPGGADAYVAQWGAAVTPLGLTNPPTSEQELHERMAGYTPVLRVDAKTRRVIEFIKNAPLPRAARPAYRILFWAAVDLLPPNYARMIAVRIPPRWLVRFLATAAVGAMRAIIGRTSPLEDAAVRRRHRLEHRKVG